MNHETLKQIIEQIKKYELTESFSDIESFEKWISELNNTQINNFLSLDINLEDIRGSRNLLINRDILSCKDYKQKITAISTLKNVDGCVSMGFSPNFFKSKNFYKDIEMLRKADNAWYALWALQEDTFINSPYHDEDLKLLVETKGTDAVLDAIRRVAISINSIKSPYHRADMKLIATTDSDSVCVSRMRDLAISQVSLLDKYHLENMQILKKNPIAIVFLYEIMTNSNFVKGKNYRKEVEILVGAKSEETARALYYYIVNPKYQYALVDDFDFYNDCTYGIHNIHVPDRNSIAGSNDRDYINNLAQISIIDDKFILYFVSLLMNPNFVNSQYKKFDLELLHNNFDKFISNKHIFLDLYRLMSNENSLESSHHKKDAVIISQTIVDNVRKLLLKSATNKDSLSSDNHDYDMQYITKLDLDALDEEIYDEICYYLFLQEGINDPQRKEKLEKLLQGELVERGSNVSRYLDALQKQIEDSDFQTIESTSIMSSKPKSVILNLLKKMRK